MQGCLIVWTVHLRFGLIYIAVLPKRREIFLMQNLTRKIAVVNETGGRVSSENGLIWFVHLPGFAKLLVDNLWSSL